MNIFKFCEKHVKHCKDPHPKPMSDIVDKDIDFSNDANLNFYAFSKMKRR